MKCVTHIRRLQKDPFCPSLGCSVSRLHEALGTHSALVVVSERCVAANIRGLLQIDLVNLVPGGRLILFRNEVSKWAGCHLPISVRWRQDSEYRFRVRRVEARTLGSAGHGAQLKLRNDAGPGEGLL